MNRLLSFLFRRAPRPDTPPPELRLSGVPFQPSPPEVLARVDLSLLAQDPPKPVPPQQRIELENLFCVIEYEDAQGDHSSRRITVLRIVPGAQGPLLQAVCHERRAMRSFRLDRIQSVVTVDGEVFTPEAFVRDLLCLDPLALFAPRPTDVAMTAARKLRDQLRAPLSILIGAAMSDRQVHVNEIDTIQIFAEREAMLLAKAGKLAGPVTVEVLDPLCRMIAAMRPQHSSLRGYVATASEWPEPRLLRLGNALTRVIEADGRLAPEEIDFVAEMNAFARASIRDRFAALELTAPTDGGDLFGDSAS